MEWIRPNYYEEFQCIADVCPDTCCAGWQIMIDEESLKRYQKTTGGFGNRLTNEIDWKEKSFCQYNGNCAFLNEMGLCDIYSELGKEALCETCKKYPRYIEEFEGVREEFLCISCPVVADMLLGRKEKVSLKITEIEEEEECYEDFDFFLFTKLQDSREYLLKMLQEREHNIETRMACLVAFGHDMQRRLRMDAVFQMDSLLEKYTDTDSMHFFEEKRKIFQKEWKERYALSQNVFALLQSLEIRRLEWKKWLEKCHTVLHKEKYTTYMEMRKQYEAKSVEWEDSQYNTALYQEQLTIYFLLHYYCGAVYDDAILSKTKLAVISAFVIEEMLFAKWIISKTRNKKADWIAITYQFAREIEHSDENLEKIEKTLTSSVKFKAQSIIKAICTK